DAFTTSSSVGSTVRYTCTHKVATDWTLGSSPADNIWLSVPSANPLFVAVSTTGPRNCVMTSPDGINWTSRSSAADNAWQSVTYGNRLFVAVSTNGTGNSVMTWQ